MCLSNEELQEQIDATKEALDAVNSAILKAMTAIAAYTLDTGQTNQSVTRRKLSELRETKSYLMNELEVLYQRKNGCGTYVVTPCF